MTVIAANTRPQLLYRSSESVSYLTRIVSSSSIAWRGQTGCRHSLSPCWWAAEACGLVTTAGRALLGCIQCPGPHWDSLLTCVCWSFCTELTWSPEDSGRADPAAACWVEGETDQTRSHSKCRVVLQQHRRERFVSEPSFLQGRTSVCPPYWCKYQRCGRANFTSKKKKATILSLLY